MHNNVKESEKTVHHLQYCDKERKNRKSDGGENGGDGEREREREGEREGEEHGVVRSGGGWLCRWLHRSSLLRAVKLFSSERYALLPLKTIVNLVNDSLCKAIDFLLLSSHF